MQSGRASTAQVVAPTWQAPAHADDDPVLRVGGQLAAGVQLRERHFGERLRQLGVEQVLDLGGSASFGVRLRRQGFKGALFSVQPTGSGYRELLAQAQADPLWFPLARQGAGGTAHFRQLGAERIFVQPSARLLRADVMQGIAAIRIDGPALQAEALEGYLPLLERVGVILLEEGTAEEGIESSTGGSCFDAAVKLRALGFEVPLSGAGQEQRGGCVLTRAEIRQPGAPATGLSLSAVVASIGGTLERRLPDGSDLGPLWLQSCMHSWQRTGASVVSVAEREPPPGIGWARTAARPSLAQMLGALPIKCGQHLLLTNADIVLTDALPALIGRLQGQAVYYGSRLDVERGSDAPAGLAPRGIYELGFDYFLLPEAFLRTVLADGLLPEQLRIGEPWWDYLLPVLALARGFPLKKLNGGPVLAMHYVHPARYSPDLWIRNRELFIQVCTRLLGEADCHAAGVLTEFLAHLDQIPHLVCRCLP